jgi:hypothetical protein
MTKAANRTRGEIAPMFTTAWRGVQVALCAWPTAPKDMPHKDAIEMERVGEKRWQKADAVLQGSRITCRQDALAALDYLVSEIEAEGPEYVLTIARKLQTYCRRHS